MPVQILSKGSTALRGCWFWSKKLHFQKNSGRNFMAVEGVIARFLGRRRKSNFLTHGVLIGMLLLLLRLLLDKRF